jgi:hypothetical protein
MRRSQPQGSQPKVVPSRLVQNQGAEQQQYDFALLMGF